MPPSTFNLAYRGTHHVKLAMQGVLRGIFASDLVDERFRYIASPTAEDPNTKNQSKIFIYRAFPQRLLSYPAIVISSGGFNPSLTATGEYQEEAGDVDGQQTYTGSVTVPITMTIFAKSVDDREELTDILVVIFRVLCRNRFADKGMGYVSLSVGGESQQDDVDGKLLYVNTLEVQVITDYTLFVTPEQSDLIQSVFTRVWASRDGLTSIELTSGVSGYSGIYAPVRSEP